MLSFEEFKNRANLLHDNKYEYYEYEGMHKKIKIKCPEHGYFKMSPSNHLKGYGCPLCHASRGELLINNYLESLNIPFERQIKIQMDKIIKNSNLIIIDFVVNLPNKRIFIEYNGIQHYQYTPFFHKGGEIDFEKQLYRDAMLRDYCNDNNIELLEIPYNLSDKGMYNLIKVTINEGKEIQRVS